MWYINIYNPAFYIMNDYNLIHEKKKDIANENTHI